MRVSSFTNSYSIMRTREKNLKPQTHFNNVTSDRVNARLKYIKTCINTQPLNICPECGGKGEYLTEDNDEITCTHCGLVLAGSIEYVAGVKVDYPYGRI